MTTTGALDGLRQGFDLAIDLLGRDMSWNRPSDGLDAVSMRCGFKSVSPQDEAIVNSYGIETRVVTISTSTTSIVPQKFDEFKMGDMTFVAVSVKDVYLNEALVGYKCYVRGK